MSMSGQGVACSSAELLQLRTKQRNNPATPVGTSPRKCEPLLIADVR